MAKDIVLCFDDDLLLLGIIQEFLRHEPFEVKCFDAGIKDLLKHEIIAHDCRLQDAPCKNGVSTVISDFNFGPGSGTNGLQFLKAIRESRCLNNSFIRLILLSARTIEEIAPKKTLDSLNILFVQKPISKDQLMSALTAKP